MDRRTFNQAFTTFIAQANPDKQIGQIPESENLWDLGYIDSLRMVDLLMFLENTLGTEIQIENHPPQVFHTFDAIYETFVRESIDHNAA